MEDENGFRWAEFHKPRGGFLLLHVPADRRLFLRTTSAEATVLPGSSQALVDVLREPRDRLAQRGAADLALQRGLFAVPLTRAWYEGYVAGHPELVSVDFQSGTDAPEGYQDKPAPLPVSATSPGKLSSAWEAGYALGPLPLLSAAYEHAGYVAGRFPLTTSLQVGGTVEVGTTASSDADVSVTRVALMPGLWWQPIQQGALRWSLGLEMGYGALWVRSASSSSDGLVPTARASAAVEIGGPQVAFRIAPAVSSLLVTLDDEEQFDTRWQLQAGLVWRRY